MPIAISFSIEGAKESEQLLGRLNKHMPRLVSSGMRRMANNVSKDMKDNMNAVFTAPRGNLTSRTRVKKRGRLQYDIVMPKYGEYVDRGTKPHSVSKPYLFKPWQRKTGTRSLSTAIFKRGTKSRPFLQKTKVRNVPIRQRQFIRGLLSDLDKTLKGGM
jgi:hypothetical protein